MRLSPESLNSRYGRLMARHWPGFRNANDHFRALVQEHLTPDSEVLDVGCGVRGIIREWSGRFVRIVGVDADEYALSETEDIDEVHLADVEASLPFEPGSFDLVTAAWVLEHFRDPAKALGNIVKVLRPGGAFIFSTTNLLNPVMLANRLAPAGFVRWYKSTVLGSLDYDTFPAYYRCNTSRRIRKLLEQVGLELGQLHRSGNPEYWKMSTPTLLLSIYANKIPACLGSWLRTHLTGVAYRSDAGPF